VVSAVHQAVPPLDNPFNALVPPEGLPEEFFAFDAVVDDFNDFIGDFDFPAIEATEGLTAIILGNQSKVAEGCSICSRTIRGFQPFVVCSWLDELRLHLASGSSGFPRTSVSDPVFLSDRVTFLEDPASLEAEVDPLALVLGDLLSGLEHDLETWVDTLCEALDSGEEQLVGRVALAAGRAYFQIATLRPSPGLEAVEALGRVARAMSGWGWQGGEPVLAAVRHWLADPTWREALLPEYGSTCRLVEWIQPLFPDSLEPFRQLLASWLEPEDDAAEVAPEISAAIGRLWRRLAHIAGSKTVLSEIEGPYALILVDRSLLDKKSRARLDSWLRDLADGLEEHEAAYLVYELGRDLPTGILNVEDSGKGSPKLHRPAPGLLGPILEAHLSEGVQGAVLFSADRPVDLADWRDTAWINKLRVVPLAPLQADPFEKTFLIESEVSPLFEPLIKSA